MKRKDVLSVRQRPQTRQNVVDPGQGQEQDDVVELPATYTEYKIRDLNQRYHDMSQYIRHLSRLAWIHSGQDIYILDCADKGFIRVRPVTTTGMSQLYITGKIVPQFHLGGEGQPQYAATHMPLRNSQSQQQIIAGTTLGDAIKLSDRYARNFVLKPRDILR